MRRAPSPLSFWTTAIDATLLMQEAAFVVTARTLALSATQGPHVTREATRMVLEKPPAFAAAANAAWIAAARGHHFHEVLAAALRPLRAKTTSNASRLRNGR